MGMNYYLTGKPPCPTCGDFGGTKHIGKSSYGWTFGLHIYPDEGINNLDDWEKFIREAVADGRLIIDEEGRRISVEELLKRIRVRAPAVRADRLRRQSEADPRFARFGGATWDYVEGDFS